MFFWFKRKTVVIDCYIDNQIMCENYQIKRGTKFIPDWWKNLSPTQIEYIEGSKKFFPTAKKCPGFAELYLKSWVVPMWTDLTICSREEGSYRYAFPHDIKHSTISSHSPFQFKNAFTNLIHIKFMCPWVVIDKQKTNTKFIFTPTSWSLFDDAPDFKMLPGVVDFTYNIGVHVNYLIPKVNAEYFIKAGTPMVHLVPLTDKDVEFRSHTVTQADYEYIFKNHNPRSYNRFYRR